MKNNSVQVSMKKFSKRAALSFAWKALIGNFGFLFVFAFIAFVLANLPLLLFVARVYKVTASDNIMSYFIVLLSKLWIIIFTPSIYLVVSRIYDKQKLSFKDFIPDFKKVVNIFVFSLLYHVFAVVICSIIAAFSKLLTQMLHFLKVGSDLAFLLVLVMVFIFIFLPVVYILLRLIFVPCFVVYESSNPFNSIKASWQISEKCIVDLGGISLIFLLPMLLNFLLGEIFSQGVVEITFLGGLVFIAAIFSSQFNMLGILAILYAYRKLSSSPTNEAATQ